MGSPDRKAASRTSPVLWFVNIFVALYMVGIFTVVAAQSLGNLEEALGTVQVHDSGNGAKGLRACHARATARNGRAAAAAARSG